MKNIKKKIWALMSAAVTTSALVVSMTGSSVTTVRDADGNGNVWLNDALVTNSYLLGRYNPTNQKSFDFDGNNIISAIDSIKIQNYLVGNIDEETLPPPSTEVINATSTTSYYFRHDCSDTNKRSYTEYSLTVDALDNSFTQNSAVSPRTIIGEYNMVSAADETAVVKIVDLNSDNYGSGFIVGDHIVATAAHCVYSENGYRDLAIKIVDEDFDVIRIVYPEYIHLPKTAIYNHSGISGNYDYALLYFDESLSQYGAFQMGVATDDYREQHGEVVVSGFTSNYPEDYTGTSENVRFKSTGNLYYSAVGSINSKNKFRFFYDADSYNGNSGGPVYVEERYDIDNVAHKYKTVVAIHSGNTTIYTSNYDYFDPNYNSGVRVTPNLLKFYYDNPYFTD